MTHARRTIAALAALFLVALPAKADYVARDGNNNLITFHSLVLGGGAVGQTQTPVDASANPYNSGNPFPVTCISGCSGGGSGGNVNINQILGAAPSAANPLWMAPATGATFPISAATLPLPNGAATQTTLASILSTMGSPMQQTGGVVGISGTLPAFAAAPTVVLSAETTKVIGTVNQGTSPWVVSGSVSITGTPTVVATGSAASGASTSGNPVLQGHVFRTTQPTVTNGQAVEAQATARGALIVATGVDAFNVAFASPPAVSVNNFPATFGISGSVAVTGTFWQATQPVSAASLPLPSGAATSAKQPALGTAGTASADVLTVQGIASMTPLAVTGTFWQTTQPVSAASLPLPSGASTAAKQPALGTAGTASADVITIQGIASMTPLSVSGTFWQATQPISAASLPLPALAATSTKQSDGSQKTQIVDGSGNVIASTSNNLNVQCANCSGSGASAVDAASFTYATSVFAPAGGFFQTTATTNPLTNGQQGMWQMTATRAGFVNVRNAAGTEMGTSSNPFQVTGANGTFPASQSGTWNITNISGTISLPTGAGTSANQTSQITQETAINTALGTQADAACGTATGTCTLISLQKFANTAITSPLPTQAPTISVGGVGIVDSAGTNVATVKAASTAPASTDKTLVVGLNPLGNGIAYPDVRPSSGTITVIDSGSTVVTTGQNGATIITGTATASSFVSNSTAGVAVVRFQVSGTWTGTIEFDQSVDAGTTWGLLGCHVNGTTFSGTSVTANGIFDCEAAGATNVRARATAAVTGTATVTTTFTAFPGVAKSFTITSGATPFHLIAANTNNSTSVKGSPGVVFAAQLGNNSTAVAYLKLYDKATAPTCGTDVPKKTIIIPASPSAAGAGDNFHVAIGTGFTLGIGICVTTGIADNDNTAPAAATYAINLDYK